MLAILSQRIQWHRRGGIDALSMAAFATAVLYHNGLSNPEPRTVINVERRGDLEGVAQEEGGLLRR